MKKPERYVSRGIKRFKCPHCGLVQASEATEDTWSGVVASTCRDCGAVEPAPVDGGGDE